MAVFTVAFLTHNFSEVSGRNFSEVCYSRLVVNGMERFTANEDLKGKLAMIYQWNYYYVSHRKI